jgi:hypothetical protein
VRLLLSILRRAVLPAVVFVVVLAVHYVWLGLFPEQDPAQGGWVALPVEKTWARSYAEGHSYWLGYSYALSLSFAAVAVRRYLERRACDDATCGPRRLALGSVTFSGFLVVAGCFLIGCCGSPMLVVWISLFGAAFLPFAKPAVAAVTTVGIGAAWWWMGRRDRPVGRNEEGSATSWEVRPVERRTVRER